MSDSIVVPLKSILCTEELDSRPSRVPDFERENRALISLTRALSDSPQTILQALADSILEMLGCGSAGISLLTNDDSGKRFFWPAIAGRWKVHIGGGTPRDFGPCGDVLDRNMPLLFKDLERRYTYFQPVVPRVEEALLVPFYIQGKAVGTVWALTHDDSRKFDAEDKRQLLSLGQFASAAYLSVTSLNVSHKLAAIVESSDDAIISKNLDGVINSWNNGAERIFGYSAEEAIGQHITLIIPLDRRDEEVGILNKIRRGERVDHFETVRINKAGTRLDISLTISPVKDSIGRVIGASKVARDISDRKRTDDVHKAAELSAQLLRVQDDERRRIARELHDGVGQTLAAAGMSVSQVVREKDKLSKAAAQSAEEVSGLIRQISAEIRTASYLLHPPMLEEIGLPTALKWYVDGFAERSKINVAIEVSSDLPRLSPDCELSLFRIVQECLTNIHRHSGSRTAFVRLSQRNELLQLEVKDEGKGIGRDLQSKINSGATTGVGFRGMHERVRMILGKLEVHSDGSGTSVLITVPLDRRATVPENSKNPIPTIDGALREETKPKSQGHKSGL